MGRWLWRFQFVTSTVILLAVEGQGGTDRQITHSLSHSHNISPTFNLTLFNRFSLLEKQYAKTIRANIKVKLSIHSWVVCQPEACAVFRANVSNGQWQYLCRHQFGACFLALSLQSRLVGQLTQFIPLIRNGFYKATASLGKRCWAQVSHSGG
jgi:hypothetical protein